LQAVIAIVLLLSPCLCRSALRFYATALFFFQFHFQGRAKVVRYLGKSCSKGRKAVAVEKTYFLVVISKLNVDKRNRIFRSAAL
jgi:hypothetical protein